MSNLTIKRHDIVKVQIYPEYLSAFDPVTKDGVYYGIVFGIDEEHITLKVFLGDAEGMMHYGVLRRFPLDMVATFPYNPDAYTFE